MRLLSSEGSKGAEGVLPLLNASPRNDPSRVQTAFTLSNCLVGPTSARPVRCHRQIRITGISQTRVSAQADSGAGVRAGWGSSGSVGGEFHDEVGVEGCADPFQQGNRGHDAARF